MGLLNGLLEPSESLGRQLTKDAAKDYRFLLPIGCAQLVSATLRLLISLLEGAVSDRTAAVRLKLLTVSASFLLYSLTGCAVLLAGRASNLGCLKRRATSCLVLCSLSAVFSVFEAHQSLREAASVAAAALDLQLVNATAPSHAGGASTRRLQSAAVGVALLGIQCVILAFAGYLCVKLIWTPAVVSRESGPAAAGDTDEAVGSDGNNGSAAAAVQATPAETPEGVEMTTQ